MERSTENVYIAIDLKSFYASMECVSRGLDPLTTNLVVADASRTDKTICLAVSPSLKAWGVPGRPRLFEVDQILDRIRQQTGKQIEYLIAPPRMETYMDVSADIYAIYLKYVSAEDIHVYSIDECFIDVSRYLGLYGKTAYELARDMIYDVLGQTGITATAGIGSNLYLCKIAMDIWAKHVPADEAGVRIAQLTEKDYRRLLWDHQPITDFWRVGSGIARQLAGIGIQTMGDLARMSAQDEDVLYRMFGIDAELLIDHAWGYEPCTMHDIKTYQPKTNSFSSGQVLQCPYEKQKARIVVQEMVEMMVLEMVDERVATDSLTLTVGYDRCNVDQGKYQGEVKIDRYGRTVPKSAHGTAALDSPSNSTRKITHAVLELYDRIVSSELFVRRITLSANRLVEEGYVQLDLFTDPEEMKKERKLQEAMLHIKKKYGKNSIIKASDLQEGATLQERNRQVGGHKA